MPDPPPDGYPDPVVGTAAPFGMFNIAADGLGYFNLTVKHFNPKNTANLLNTAAGANCFLTVTFGGDGDWKDAAGNFSLPLWKASVDRVYNDSFARAALEAAQTSGVALCHYVIDEPYHPRRWGPAGPIPFNVVEQMCQYSKAYWSTWATMIALRPTEQAYWMTRHMNGLDWLHHDYVLRNGDVVTWLDAQIARAAAIDHLFIPGLHYASFAKTPSGAFRNITVDEWRHYGRLLCRAESPFFLGWRYYASIIALPGWWAATKEVRDYWASLHP